MNSRYYQLWPQMALMSGVLTGLSTYFLLCISWGWSSELGEFGVHRQHMIGMLVEMMSGVRVESTEYWMTISSAGLKVQWLVHLLVPVVFSLVSAVVFSFWLLYVPGGRDRAVHLSGVKLLKGAAAVGHAKMSINRELRDDPMGRGIALFSGIQIPVRRELDNIFVYGKQGAGKGVVIKPLVNQAIARGDRVLIYDEKREYTELFLSESSVLVSPADARSVIWNPSLDVDSREGAALFAESLIAESGKDPFWANGARQILTGCIIYLISKRQAWGWRQLNDVLNQPRAKLKRLLETHLPAAANLVEEDSKTTQSILSILSTQLNWIPSLAKYWPDSHKSKFAVSSWLSDSSDRKVVIIASNPLHQSMASPLCTAFITLATERLLALPDSESRRIWFSLDEIGNLKKCPSILRLLSLGRSKGSRVIAGIQAISMLREIYGAEESESMMSLFGNIVTLSTGAAGDTAKKAAEALGERVVEIPVRSIDSQGNISHTFQVHVEQVINATDITQLPKSTNKYAYGYLLVSGWGAIYRLDWPVMDIPKNYKAYVPQEKLRQHGGQRKWGRGSNGRKSC